MKRNLAIWCGIICIILSLSVVTLRYSLLRIPLTPSKATTDWEIELGVRGNTERGTVLLSLYNPSVRNAYRIVDRSFASDGFSLVHTKLGSRSTFVFSKKNLDPAEHTFSSRLRIQRDTKRQVKLAQIKPSRRFSPDQKKRLLKIRRGLPKDELGRKKFVRAVLRGDVSQLKQYRKRAEQVDLLNILGIPSRLYYGFRLRDGERIRKFSPFLLTRLGQKDLFYSYKDRRFVPRANVFLWGSTNDPIHKVIGFQNNISWQIVAASLKTGLPRASRKTSGVIAESLRWFSLSRLPLATQTSFRILLLLPLAALVVALMRNVIGMKTFGTFMPALIALSFRDTGLGVGLFLFLSVVGIGLIMRFFFRYFRLLLVPRLTSTLTAVVVLLFLLALLGVDLQMPLMSSIAIFPVVILAMIVERMSVSIEEDGLLQAIRTLFFSLIAALSSYVVVTLNYVEYLFTVFPELLLLVFGLSLLLGRYFGYRVVELIRFRHISDSE